MEFNTILCYPLYFTFFWILFANKHTGSFSEKRNEEARKNSNDYPSYFSFASDFNIFIQSIRAYESDKHCHKYFDDCISPLFNYIPH